MKARRLLLALCLLLVFPALAWSEGATPRLEGTPVAVEATLEDAMTVPAPPEPLALPATFGCAAVQPLALAELPFSTSLVCDGVNYPFCNPGGSCLDPCCYCSCRAEGLGPGICAFECCLGH